MLPLLCAWDAPGGETGCPVKVAKGYGWRLLPVTLDERRNLGPIQVCLPWPTPCWALID